MVGHAEYALLGHVAHHDGVDIHLYVVIKLRAVEGYCHLRCQAPQPAVELLGLAGLYGDGDRAVVGGATVLAHREDAEHLGVVGNRGAVPGALDALEAVASADVLLVEIFDVCHAVDIVACRGQLEVEVKTPGGIVAKVAFVGQAVVGIRVIFYIGHVARGVGDIVAALADMVFLI